MSDAACRLYFDLEFDRQLNPTRNGERMVDIFLQVVHRFTSLLSYSGVVRRFQAPAVSVGTTIHHRHHWVAVSMAISTS